MSRAVLKITSEPQAKIAIQRCGVGSDVFPTLQGRVCKGISLKYIVIGGIDVSGTRS
ncbi:MAG: hypothetical protein ACLRI8_01850 [Agathobacter rectalis]